MTEINMAILWVCLVALLIPSGLESISIVGPKVLRPFGNYRVAVSGGPRAQTLYVAVEGRQGNGEQYSQGREVQVQPASSRIIDLDIGDPGPGQYSLIARSTSGPQFSSSARLIYQPRSFIVFIQSDKRIYQPGDTIRFRVVALDKFLLPLSGSVEISILDARGSPVRQWAGVEVDRGIATNEFVVADEPGLGEWTIEVESRGQKYSRNILVADYVMPKFNMKIQMPKQILFTDGRFNINVTAKHFNGLPVEGELTISAYAVFFSGLLQPVFSSPARKVIDFKGQTDVIYDLKTDLDLAEDAARPLVVEAVLEEKDTLIKQNVSSRILLLRAPYRLKVSAPDYFKPTLPYNVQIELVDPSGQVMDSDGDVTVERLWDDGAPTNVTTIALKNGLATYSIVPDKAHTNSTLNLLIKYKEVTERVVNVQRSDISSGQFLTVEILTRETNVGEEMRARISATEPMDLVHYVVIARGDIIIAKTLELNPARKSVDISVPVTKNMSPGSVVLAWYPRLSNDNVLPTAAVFAPHKHTYQHKMVVLTSSSTYRLNSTIELRVSGEPGAHVALMGEDTNAIAAGLAGEEGLGTGLNLHTIQREAESFNGLKHSLFKNEDDLPTMGVDLGGYSTADVFDNAGVVILTDSNIGRVNNEGEDLRQIPETGTRPPLAGPYAFSRLPPPPSPRYYLTVSPQPTWLLANFSLDSDGKGVEVRRSPQSSGHWKIGAFAVHPQLGLTLAEPQLFKTTVPLTITTELPPSLQKGETLAVVVTLKSSLTVDTSVEITFHNTEQFYEFEPLDNSIDAPKKIELYRRLRLTIPANGLASTAFLVSAVKSGEAPIIVEAQGNGVSASLLQTIFVNDGYEEEISSWGLLDARRGVAHGNISLTPLAGTRLSGAALLAAGDVLAPALQAARAPPAPAASPAGAVRPLARAALLLDYLQATDRNQAALNKELREQASIGYQRLMAYRRPDGSFAPDTGDETEGDVWMTAIACKWLSRAARYVQVSPAAATSAARWLQKQQSARGDWPPAAPAPVVGGAAVSDPHAQAPHALAAHVSLALHEQKGNLYNNAMNKAIDYIARSLPEMKDPYTLAVASYALAMAKHPQAQEVLQMMEKFANTTETSVFWSRKLSGTEWRNPWLRHNSLEASTAAFALRTMIALRLTDQAGPVANFLLQANQLSDQDPEVLDALAQYAEATKTSTKLRISVNVTGSEELRQFTIEDDKSLIINTKLVRNARSAFATTEGRGMAILGLQAKGYTNVTAAWPRYILDPRVDQVSTKDRLQLSICIGFVPQGNDTESGITLMTVYLPSGYLADIHTVTELASLRHVSAARVSRGGAVVRAWLRAARAERCATLAAPRARPTARQRPGAVTLVDTSDDSHRARVFFSAVSASACDACRQWDSCARACGASAQQLPANDRPGGAGWAGGAGGAGGKGGAGGSSAAAGLLLALAAAAVLLR